MARAANNVLLLGVSGKLGGVVIRQMRDGSIRPSAPPDFRDRQFSDAPGTLEVCSQDRGTDDRGRGLGSGREWHPVSFITASLPAPPRAKRAAQRYRRWNQPVIAAAPFGDCRFAASARDGGVSNR